MKEIELMVGLIAVIGIVGVLTQKIKVSLPILLVLTGMALSHIPHFSPVKLEPDTVFFIFLPPPRQPLLPSVLPPPTPLLCRHPHFSAAISNGILQRCLVS